MFVFREAPEPTSEDELFTDQNGVCLVLEDVDGNILTNNADNAEVSTIAVRNNKCTATRSITI